MGDLRFRLYGVRYTPSTLCHVRRLVAPRLSTSSTCVCTCGYRRDRRSAGVRIIRSSDREAMMEGDGATPHHHAKRTMRPMPATPDTRIFH
jgi:hypothetical protein